jgi:8-oxo-dGTP diphosphatase
VLFVGLAHVPAATEVAIDPEHDAYAWWPPDPADWPDEADPPLRLMAQLLAG